MPRTMGDKYICFPKSSADHQCRICCIEADLAAEPALPALAHLSPPACVYSTGQGQRGIREIGDRVSLKQVVMELMCHAFPFGQALPRQGKGRERVPILTLIQGRKIKGTTCREGRRGKFHLTTASPLLAEILSSAIALGHQRRVVRVTRRT